MDLWIAIAAASAGYAVKHWQNLSRDRQSSPDFESKFVRQELSPVTGLLRDKSHLFGRLTQAKMQDGDVSIETELQVEQNASATDVASASELDNKKLDNVGNHDDCNLLSISSFPAKYLSNEDFHKAWEVLDGNPNVSEKSGNSFPETSTTEVGTSYRFARTRSSLRSIWSNMQFIKPLTSLESCVMAQLYKEHIGMKEYVLSCVPSLSSPAARPCIVTDGRRIISKAMDGSLSSHIEIDENKLNKKICSVENTTASRVLSLPNAGSMEPLRRRLKAGKGPNAKLNSSSKLVDGKLFHSLAGSSHGELIFCLGVSIGVISSLIANKREVDRLTHLLKQTENLVQDLQDELEMKDSLTVKELSSEHYEPHDTLNGSSSSEHNLAGSVKFDTKELLDQKAEDDSKSMSKIEAELEAELERLELTMKSSSLEGRLSNVVEPDPDFIPGITEGELVPEMFGKQGYPQPCADQDGSGTSTPHTANYVVSPHKLTLRLHEVIRLRMEERIKELEKALETSERKLHFMESEHKMLLRDLSEGKLRSSSQKISPIVMQEPDSLDQAVVINLAGEALDAYHEAYDEFMKMNESEEADRQDTPAALSDQNGYQPDHTTGNSKASPALFPDNLTSSLEEHISSGDMHFSRGDETGDSDDEMESLLIKQIVEKSRKNSCVVSAENGIVFVGRR
ncbi:uncharacterized protein LOC127792945 [Diospyros lotus]|uniref:uncharacterized protein LOC127792945 n=1 Tax=Diospyros lotus TaxID=55363 RepID=UPI00225ACB7E|nr:uncharacterized protein LOC127792945 [Diospyros lotus]XP_052179588.1 uncharacterized protein LOC127792945 [Diospyros lotus]